MLAKLSVSATVTSSSQSKLSLKISPTPKKTQTTAGTKRPTQKMAMSKLVLCKLSCVREREVDRDMQCARRGRALVGGVVLRSMRASSTANGTCAMSAGQSSL